ncbi:uncharacterized protein PRCAT00003274001 [Priceomyces carsonii]|uniref:uncharacterized protein n=1 Tax=Priceomyces carsonii TaxID=28549 RepID=UPI002ED8647E|nr:unnamed protein product [Priceomyces carsonii]
MISNEYFSRNLLKIIGLLCLPRRILVGVSGGVDSICLAFLLSEYRKRYQPELEITAVTIDHSYRHESNREAISVGEQVKKWGLNHIIRKLEYDKPVHSISNFEEVARQKRFEEFRSVSKEIKSKFIFVGHNQDDQIETYLQRLQQGSTLFGLRGLQLFTPLPMPAEDPADVNIFLVRPLLGFSKEEIRSNCCERGIEWFEDKTNNDIFLTKRNRLRFLVKEVSTGMLSSNSLILLKLNLIKTHNEVVRYTDKVDQHAKELYKTIENSLTFNKGNGSLVLNIPIRFMTHEMDLILSRLLYWLLYPISSIKHYHWAYAKIERQMVPKLIRLKEGNENRIKLVCLNLTIVAAVNHKTGNIMLTCFRQPLLKEDNFRNSLSITSSLTWGHWILFDRRFWLRFRLPFQFCLRIVPFTKNIHTSLLNEVCDIKERHIEGEYLEGVPLVFKENSLVSVPTYDLFIEKNIEVEWCLKQHRL